MYTNIQIERITAGYFTELAQIPALAEVEATAIMEERQREMMERYAMDSIEVLIPHIISKIDECDLEMKELEFADEIHSLQIALIEQANSLPSGEISEPYYQTQLEAIFQAHIARYRGYAKDRLARAITTINEDGEEDVTFEYDREELERRVASFRETLLPSKKSFSFFCQVLNHNEDIAEFVEMNERILEVKRERYDELLQQKTVYGQDFLNLNREPVVAYLKEHLTADAERSFAAQLQSLSTSLHHYCESGNINEISELFRKQDSREAITELVNENSNGSLPLHIACQQGDIALAQLLIENGANPDLLDGEEADEDRKTARDYARTSGILDELFPTPRRTTSSTAAAMRAMTAAATVSSSSIETTTDAERPRLTPRPQPKPRTCWDYFACLFFWNRPAPVRQKPIVDIYAPVRSFALTR